MLKKEKTKEAEGNEIKKKKKKKHSQYLQRR